MPGPITTLIDKLDGNEIVRDQIATLLAAETLSQQALALAASKDPDLWKFRVFTERANPWESFRDADNIFPIVNVWVDDVNFNQSRGNTHSRQQADGTFNVDVYGYGTAADDGGAGHKPGDREAALETQRAVRLVRNILMAAHYTYLDLRNPTPPQVGQRWVQSIKYFQPQIDTARVPQVIGARIALRVRYNEISPQVVGDVLEELNVKMRRVEDGEILVEAEYDYT